MIPLDPLVVAAVCGAVALAVLVRSSFGFGDGLVAMPLVSMAVGARIATPTVALMSLVMAVIIVWRSRREANWRAAGRLVAAAALGIPFGIAALRNLEVSVLNLILGVILVVVGAGGLIPWGRRPMAWSPHMAWPMGALAGLLGAAMNTAGPPLLIHATMSRWSPPVLRATLQGFFLPLSIVVTASHGIGGLWSREVFWLAALSIPGGVVMIPLGKWLNRRFPAERFRKVVYGILLLLGGMLLAQ